MTARDKAIEAIEQAGASRPLAADAIDAIPPNALALLAIERGGLVEVEILDEYAGSSEVMDAGTDSPVDGNPKLYRLVLS